MSSPRSGCTTCSKEVAEGYTIIKTLGKGTFAEVKEVQKKDTKKRFAWKQIQLDKDPRYDLQIQMLRRVQHNNIVRLYDVYWTAGVIDIMLELCDAGTMAECIASQRDSSGSYKTPSPMKAADALSQLLMAVNFIHENQVVHRDIRPCNVLLSSEKRWKLSNFDLACGFDPGKPLSQKVGSAPYRAPEIDRRSYTEKCDVYSIGVLFIAFARGDEYVRPSLQDARSKDAAEKLLNEKTWSQRLGFGALAFARQMIAVEDARCDSEEALQNAWLVQNRDHASPSPCCVIA